MNIAEHLASLRKSREAARAKMLEVTQKSMDEGRSMNDAEQQEFDALEAEIKTLDADIARFSKLQDMQAAEAEPVEGQAKESEESSVKDGKTFRVAKNTQKLDKGIEFARYAMCLAKSKGNLEVASAIAQKQYPEMDRINTVLKAAVSAGTTTDADWAKELVEYNDFAGDFVEYLRPRTIIGQFGTGGIPALRRVPFNVHIKGQNAGAAANWVGEGYAKPVTSAGYDDAYLGWAKVAGIAVITDELARFSNPGAEALVRDELAAAVIERIDTDFVDPNKAAGTGATASPASITNGVTPVAATTDPEADIDSLWATADAQNMPATSAVYITDASTARKLRGTKDALGNRVFPDVTMLGGSIDGVPVIVSNYVPTDTSGSMFILAFASEIWLADDNVVTLDASREASILMADNAGSSMNSGTPTGAANLVSMYQTNSVALRAERYINWAKRRTSAVAYLDGISAW